MERISDKRKCMAALAVFRQLYDSRKNIYKIISEFVKHIITKHGLKSFELQEIKNLLCQEYGFDIPSAVLRSSLKSLKNITSSSSGNFIVSKEFVQDKENEEFSKISNEAEEKNQRIIDSLISYVSEKQGSLSDSEKEKLSKAFCVYIIDDTTNVEYKDLISSFLLINEENDEFIHQLNQIKQGIIIYIGLTYNVDRNSVDSIDRSLNIYLETEILFSMVGYNGILYQQLFNEFYMQIAEINKRANKTLVRLFYFIDTQKEIESFFSAAEHIVRGEMTLDPSNSAMNLIVNGCSKPYEISSKKTDFYSQLKENGVELDNQERYYDRDNQQYNIDYNGVLSSPDFVAENDEDVNRCLSLLNYISIKRGGKDQKYFRNIGHILLTGNNLTFKISSSPCIKKEKTVPLATSLGYLTERFWLSLNKGMSNSMNLRSFNIITKAQIVLSSSLSESIGKIYKELLDEDKEGKFDSERNKQDLADLHSKIVLPENIKSENEDSYLKTISLTDISTFRAEQELQREALKNESEAIKIENESIKTHSEAIQKEKEEVSKRFEISQKERDEAISMVDSLAKQSCDERNKVLREKYERAKIEYNDRLDSEVESIVKQKIKKSRNIVFKYFGSVILLFIIQCLFNVSQSFLIANFLLFVMPFIRPLINHTPIAEAFWFIISQDKKEDYREKVASEFKSSNKEPELKLLTPEDIKNELREGSN